MPTQEEYNAIMALAIKAATRINDEATKKQARIVTQWAQKWISQRERARENANKWNKEHPDKHRITNKKYARRKARK